MLMDKQAEAFQQGWGQIIFQSANEINQNRLLKERVNEIQGKTEAEKSWWENKRSTIKSELMKELEVDDDDSVGDAVLVENDGQAQGSKKKGGKKK